MIARLRPLLVLLPLAIVLVAPGGALAAPVKTTVYPAQSWAILTAHGTHGWTLEVIGTAEGRRPDAHALEVFASGPHHQAVGYSGFRGHFNPSGRMEARLPGVGRIDVRYEAASHEAVHTPNSKNCTSAGAAVDSQGVFRGTIELHGEGGYTTVALHSARGQLLTYPRQTCRERLRKQAVVKSTGGKMPQTRALDVQEKHGAGRLRFEALSTSSMRRPAAGPHVEFTAEYSHRRNGMWIDASTTVEGKPEEFSTSPTATPSGATVEPPAPFEGSAEFTLESRTVAGWTGDLRVPIPTLGTVDLTGPTFGEMLCEDENCTETLPGVKVGFSISFLE